MKNYFQLLIRLSNDDRLNILVTGEDILSVAEKLKGPQLTFIPQKLSTSNTFTIYTHNIFQIQYEVVNVSHFDHPIVYNIHSF